MSKMSERLALHTWSLDTTPLPETLRAARAGGWNAMELRRMYVDGESVGALADTPRQLQRYSFGLVIGVSPSNRCSKRVSPPRRRS